MITSKTTPKNGGLQWPQLIRGRLIRRYKRFLADVALDHGETVTAHCSNSGRMTGCSQPGQIVYLSLHNLAHRKLKYTWELIEMPTSLVGVNTLVPNQLVASALAHKVVDGLNAYTEIFREVTINQGSRLDLKLSGPHLPDCFIEVKNCTMVENGDAKFPDAPTIRGQKHLQELIELKKNGMRTVMFFLVQRMDAHCFSPADEIDPEYGRRLRQAVKKGVEIITYDVTLNLEGIWLRKPLPYTL